MEPVAISLLDRLLESSVSESRRGGARPNSGPPKRRVLLSAEAARAVTLLQPYYPGKSRDEIVSSLIEAKWHDIDEAMQSAAREIAHEPFIV